jgi:hypothetical protein
MAAGSHRGSPYLGSDERLRILVDPPEKALSGTLIEGHVYVDAGIPMIIHDRAVDPTSFRARS